MRAIFGIYLWLSFLYFKGAVARRYGSDTGTFLVLVTCCQFHLPFYLTRTLPNTFALALALLAWAQALQVGIWRGKSSRNSGGGLAEAFAYDDNVGWMGQGSVESCTALLALATTAFRCDILVLAGPLLLTLLLLRRIGIVRLLVSGMVSGILSLGEH